MGPSEDPDHPSDPSVLVECRWCGSLVGQTRPAMDFHRNRCPKRPREEPKRTLVQELERATKF